MSTMVGSYKEQGVKNDNAHSGFILTRCDLQRLAHSTRDVESILRLIMHKHMT
jgi:hypothetical protein